VHELAKEIPMKKLSVQQYSVIGDKLSRDHAGRRRPHFTFN
jgi:hypothetical protein